MRTPAVLAALLAASLGCSRDLSLPPPPGEPGAGSISGRIVFAQPGSVDKLAAYGSRVELLGTGRVVYADTEGRFVLEGIDFTATQLLVQFDPGATGTPSRQKLLDLGAFGAKPGLQLSIGDVPVNENARLRGKILRLDAPGPSGHAGTVVYVPQGPFTTFTNDDGSFELRDMPEGTVSVAAFRTGYASLVVDGITLRAGEDFTMRELTVAPLSGGGTGDPGTIRGTVTFDPPPAGAGTTSVSAVDGAGASHAAAAAADGGFLIENVPPGVYQLTAVRLGYVPTIVPNVAVAPGGATVVSGLRLAAEGSGGTCAPNTVCQPTGAGGGCKVGVTSCTGGTTCTVAGNALDGIACGAGSVCKAGECRKVCDAGRVCAPANACHVGVVVCDAGGTATCTDIGAQLPDGYACGTNLSCSAGACVPCTGASCGTCSVQCAPANPCHVGARSCDSGASGACTDTGLLVADGTGCGTNAVCRAGTCQPCSAGSACETPTNRCKAGFLSCATGFAVCVEGANKDDGTACGSGDVCRSGACVPAGGQVQTLVDEPSPYQSMRGVVAATNGDVYYVDYYGHVVKRVPAGAFTAEVIAGKQGQAGPSADNQPATDATLYYPYALALDESVGLLYLSDSNDRIRAIQLGGNRWIINVAGGGSPPPPGPGYGDDGPATSAVLAQPEQLALGTDGAKRYLYFRDAGHARFRRIDLTASPGRIEAWDLPTSCSLPVAVSSCGGANSCGLASAGIHGMFVSGYLCGTQVGTTTYGIVRVPPGGAAPVHVLGKSPGLTTEGGFSRSTSVTEPPGLATDAAGNLYYATLGSNQVRRISPTGVVRTVAGTGAAGTGGDGGTALAATFDGPTSLAFNRNLPSPGLDAFVTESRGNVLRRVLNLGSALFERGSLTGSSGVTQTAVLGQSPPSLAGATLLDAAGGAMPGFEVEAVTTSTPPAALQQSSAMTDVNGVAAFGLRVGFLPGPDTVAASYRDIYGVDVPGSPATFTVTAEEPPAGTIMTVVNEDRQTSGAAQPGFGPLARLYYPTSAVTGPDGTIYVTAHYSHRVMALAPDGWLRVVAGNGSASSQGDGGLAVDASFYYPYAAALDDTGSALYVADSSNHKIRVVNLQTGIIGTLAGTGTSGSTGDGGPASLAQLATPYTLAQRGGKLYVGENNGSVRMIDLTASPPTITTVLQKLASGSCAGEVTFNGCQSGYGCGLAVDAAGALYVSAYACGTATGGYYTYAVVKWDGTTLSHVAGRYLNANDTDGAAASAASFSQPPGLGMGPGGRLFLAEPGNHRIRFVDFAPATPVMRRWFGAATPGYAGNYVRIADDPFAIQLNYPSSIAFTPAGHAVVVDYYNHAVRLVWKGAQALP